MTRRAAETLHPRFESEPGDCANVHCIIRVKVNVMKWIALCAIGSALVAGPAVGQSSRPMQNMGNSEKMAPAQNDSDATKGYKQSMLKMMADMPAYTGDADIDFMKQMRAHHQAAIDMAEVVLAHGKDPQTKSLAKQIIGAQKKEVNTIDAWLKAKRE